MGTALAAILFGGCSLFSRSPYVKPDIPMPQQWQAQAGEKNAGWTEKFWESFDDPLLNRLIEEVLAVNNDIRVAAITVRRARLEADLTRTDIHPTPSLSADGSYHNDLKNGDSSKIFTASAGLNYEIDLWGKYADRHGAAVLEAEATEADRRSAALSLVGTTAGLYWQIAYLNQLIGLNRSDIDYAQQTLDLVRARYDAGAASRLDLIQSQRNLIVRETSLTQNLQTLAEARHAFTILFDRAPDKQPAERPSLEGTFAPRISAGIPADVLHNRPDLSAAELRLRKAHKEIGITKADYYPAFNLTGDLGSSSMHLREILQNPAATLGASLALPFIQWNVTRLNVEISETDYAKAVISFRQTLFTALSEVENALSARIHYQDEGKKYAASLHLAMQAEKLSEIRYLAGESELQDWLDEQELRREAEKTILENHFNQLKNSMQLFLALGGGDPSYEVDKPGLANFQKNKLNQSKY